MSRYLIESKPEQKDAIMAELNPLGVIEREHLDGSLIFEPYDSDCAVEMAEYLKAQRIPFRALD